MVRSGGTGLSLVAKVKEAYLYDNPGGHGQLGDRHQLQP